MEKLNDSSPVWAWASNGEIQYITVPAWVSQRVKVGFSARTGGCSQAPYQSLNLGLHVGDDYAQVIANRQALTAALSASPEQMVCCQQVHGSEIALVDASLAGRGSVIYDTALPDYDGMVCHTPGLLLATFYADCFPLFFFDPVHRAVGLAHSGWKGVMGRIGARTVAEMGRCFNSRPPDIQVLIGPGIQSCCFEIGPELADRVRQEFSAVSSSIIDSRDTVYHWDLPATIRHILKQSGIRQDNIMGCDLCPACRTDLFFSYRKEGGVTGRMAAMIGLE